jgi:hypothetical protein
MPHYRAEAPSKDAIERCIAMRWYADLLKWNRAFQDLAIRRKLTAEEAATWKRAQEGLLKLR